MPERVSFETAKLLRERGFPQDIHTGDFVYHPQGEGSWKLVQCTKGDGKLPQAEPTVIKAPTKAEASAWLESDDRLS